MGKVNVFPSPRHRGDRGDQTVEKAGILAKGEAPGFDALDGAIVVTAKERSYEVTHTGTFPSPRHRGDRGDARTCSWRRSREPQSRFHPLDTGHRGDVLKTKEPAPHA